MASLVRVAVNFTHDKIKKTICAVLIIHIALTQLVNLKVLQHNFHTIIV